MTHFFYQTIKNILKWNNSVSFLFLMSTIVFFSVSCSEKKKQEEKLIPHSNTYAKGFEITEFESFKKITVFNPWEQANKISIDYYLFQKGSRIPDSLKNKNIIFTPVQRIVCLSTSHVAFIDAVNESEKVVGVSGLKYVSSLKIRERIDEGLVVDVGYGQNLNYELLLKQKPELVMVYGIDSEVSNHIRKMEDLGINVIMNAEYLEETPLGKAEWIKFIGCLFEKETVASDFFQSVEQEYLYYKNLPKPVSEQPKVIVGLPFKDSWWVPGGNSYFAHLIEDAGGDYIGKNNDSHESYVISFENALIWASQATVWLNVGGVFSKPEILSSDERFKKFNVFNEGRIFNNNLKMNQQGGNDFWESGAVYPNKVLKDLIKVFYPKQLTEVKFEYYREIGNSKK